MTTTLYQSLRLFLSSPSDAKTERDACESIVGQINKTLRDTLGAEIEVVRWEDFSATPKHTEGQLQNEINKLISSCHFFVLILNRRYGTKEEGHTKSNTEREVDVALELFRKHKRMTLLFYFRSLEANQDPGEQERELVQLEKRLAAESILYKKFDSTIEFRELFTHDLYRLVIRFQISSTKQEKLRHIFRFGDPEGHTSAKLAIVYPPMNRQYMIGMPNSSINLWHERLAPHIVFEDFKAIQKVERCLRLIGFHNYEILPTQLVPPDFDSMNRMFICLPRSRKAIAALDDHRSVARFQFERTDDRFNRILHWQITPNSKQWIKIASPLQSYLSQQRRNDAVEWTNPLGQIIAKDYAIFARLPNYQMQANSDEPLYDYFLAGIRGLGTWGAAWYIDRRYKEFERFEGTESFQLLLEVTFQNNRIKQVRDVSDEPEEYFTEQLRDEKIRSEIERFQEENDN